jgi:uncharacterized membrane protein
VRISPRTVSVLIAPLLLFGASASSISGRTAAQTSKPQTQTAKPLPAGPPAPQSTHHPVLILAFGNSPNWSLRIGQKGPERFDRAGYPPISLEASDVTNEATPDSWTYHAKDSATGAAVAVHLTRQTCTDATNDTLGTPPPANGKFTFRASVEHAQLGVLNGCARIAAELFPRINNQADDDEEDDAKKKPPASTVTKFKAPTSVAYLNANNSVVVSRGAVKKVAAPFGTELCLSHDGKKLLYTRSDSKTGPERSIILYDFDTGKSLDLVHGLVRQAFWSPDDSRVALLKGDDHSWHVWTFPVSAPDTGAMFSPQPVNSLHGWIDTHTILASDMQNAYWLSDETLPQAVALSDIYGSTFQIMSSDTIRSSPINPDLLLVSAYYANAPAGASVDSAGLAAGIFLYELHSKRRTILIPVNQWGQAAQWSRDSLQIFFTSMDSTHHAITNKLFWDGVGLLRAQAGSHYVIGQ